ncbi:MAG: cytidylate kinase-like family protein, partial [Treponemataceae bacterium]|nr:cytidylate kinase-like family protein [Treponemataceae bacterium]
IYADEAAKIERAIKAFNTPEKDAKKVIQQRNKRRANHYNMFTEHVWGERTNYDLLVNSSVLGLDGTAQFIAQFARQA